MHSPTSSPRIMVIAGEVSGDMRAASLVEALQRRIPAAQFFGIGGDAMRRAGVDTLHDVDEMAVMGFAEVLKRYGFFKRVFHEMLAEAERRKPDAVILVDYPGFNLRFAKRTHALGLRNIYYICPQVWAWHRSRMAQMAACVEKLISIFPFEADHFRKTGLDVTFVGHPLVEETQPARKQTTPLNWGGSPRVALLPGSRLQEIERMLPTLWQSAREIEKAVPGTAFIVASPSARIANAARTILGNLPHGPAVASIVEGRTLDVLGQADAAIVASGTATIETALMRCPMAVVYKTSPLTYWFARFVIQIRNIGMVNIIAGKTICPEFIQGHARPRAIAKAIVRLLRPGPERDTMLNDLDRVCKTLGPPGAVERAADIVADLLDNHNDPEDTTKEPRLRYH